MSKFKKSLKWIAILLVSVVVIAAIAFKLLASGDNRQISSENSIQISSD